MAKTEKKLIANNKKAYHDYFILEKYEVGLVLHGTEVKSLRMGKCSIKESFIRVEDGEMYIYGMHISPYEKGNIFTPTDGDWTKGHGHNNVHDPRPARDSESSESRGRKWFNRWLKYSNKIVISQEEIELLNSMFEDKNVLRLNK